MFPLWEDGRRQTGLVDGFGRRGVGRVRFGFVSPPFKSSFSGVELLCFCWTFDFAAPLGCRVRLDFLPLLPLELPKELIVLSLKL